MRGVAMAMAAVAAAVGVVAAVAAAVKVVAGAVDVDAVDLAAEGRIATRVDNKKKQFDTKLQKPRCKTQLI